MQNHRFAHVSALGCLARLRYSHLHVARLAQDGTLESMIDLMQDLKADCHFHRLEVPTSFVFLTVEMAHVETGGSTNESTDSGVYLIPSRRRLEVDQPGYAWI